MVDLQKEIRGLDKQYRELISHLEEVREGVSEASKATSKEARQVLTSEAEKISVPTETFDSVRSLLGDLIESDPLVSVHVLEMLDEYTSGIRQFVNWKVDDKARELSKGTKVNKTSLAQFEQDKADAKALRDKLESLADAAENLGMDTVISRKTDDDGNPTNSWDIPSLPRGRVAGTSAGRPYKGGRLSWFVDAEQVDVSGMTEFVHRFVNDLHTGFTMKPVDFGNLYSEAQQESENRKDFDLYHVVRDNVEQVVIVAEDDDEILRSYSGRYVEDS